MAKVALVTGANKGIGYAIVKNLALKYTELQRTQSLTIYLSARNKSLGETSLTELQKELKPQKILSDDGGNVDLKFMRIDLTDEQTMENAKEDLLKNHGGLDILINNAAMAFKGSAFDVNVVRTTFATNFYGTLKLCNYLLPIIRPEGRLINIASSAGRLGILSQELAREFTNDDLDVDGLIALMKKFEDAVEKGTWAEEGWPTNSYGMSKVGVTALTRILARRVNSEGKDILVSACCPGWVRTDMAGPAATLTTDQGAETPVFLALDETTVPQANNGEFWKRCKVAQW
ncbi:6428_t:CDS:2 [Paraglomus brasilianum]|uniref:6428_t:CDS:1 n=1 Tax=Paraglomus brasilianum TaxID=144538 RepID=A0A9N9H208_9GLOM|nr:6428_t:CDS:2 [Paraglomus brasilianum]